MPTHDSQCERLAAGPNGVCMCAHRARTARLSQPHTVGVITVRVHLPTDVSTLPEEEYRKIKTALASLADVMGVQAEDGLYLGGSPNLEGLVIDGEDVENVHVSDIDHFTTDVHLETAS